MEIMELFLVLVVAVLVSALLDRRLPRVAGPLVQIAIGLLMALILPISPIIEADPEFFLLLFIAPILFYESRELDRAALWADKAPVLSLSIGLVLVMMVLVGVVLHLLLPTVPWGLCFAVGAALGPTDAAAVVAMAGSVKFPKRVAGVLGAEAIFNDATGVVAFQFALAAAVSGAFDPGAAFVSFLIEFLGGLIFGAVLGAVGNWLTTLIHGQGMTSTTFHVLFEIAMPFLAFLLGQAIGVSGVLAAVACGLVFDLRGNGTGADVSKTKIISTGFWNVAMFTLNGIVFVLLGLQLPSGFEAILSPELDTALGFATVAAVLAVVLVFRFIWCTVLVKTSKRHWGDNNEDLGLWRSSALLTFGGAKGAITMSTILMIPASFASRNTLVFVASCVIIATLILTNIVMPRLVKQEDASSDDDKAEDMSTARIAVLRHVMSSVPKVGRQMGMEPAAITQVVSEYRERIVNVTGSSKTDPESRELRIEAIGWERERLSELSEQGDFTRKDIEHMKTYLDQKEGFYADGSNWKLSAALAWKRLVSTTMSWFETFATSLGIISGAEDDEEIRNYAALRNECSKYAITKLREKSYDDPTIAERMASLIGDYQLDMESTLAYTPQVADVARINSQAAALRLEALGMENDAIEEALEDGKIDKATVAEMRRTVAMIRFDAEEML